MNQKPVWGWALYDWANSAFATTVMAGFFPPFFKEFWSVSADVNISTARLGFANTGAGLLVALMAPVLGAIADKGALRKRFLVFFTYFGVFRYSRLARWPRGGVLLLSCFCFSQAGFYSTLSMKKRKTGSNLPHRKTITRDPLSRPFPISKVVICLLPISCTGRLEVNPNSITTFLNYN